MASTSDDTPPTAKAEALPDYLTSPNAVLGDKIKSWRYGRAPDYSKTRQFYQQSKKMNHEPGSLPELVENLVKNWEVEASFKTNYDDWRTVVPEKYTFSINGSPPQDASHMLRVGTYNAIIAPNDYYSPDTSDFASSHKTFKRMMPTFAWEVLDVYSGPPRVTFKWRHWGVMKNDYVGFNDKGEKITAKAHGGSIDIQGVTIATVDDKVRVEALETWFDPLEMFRQIAPKGIVTRVARTSVKGEDLSAALDDESPTTSEPSQKTSKTREQMPEPIPMYTRKVTIPGAFPDAQPLTITETRTSKAQPAVYVPTTSSTTTAASTLITDRFAGLSVPAAGSTQELNRLVVDLSAALDALKVELAKGPMPESGASSPESWVNVKLNHKAYAESDAVRNLQPGEACAEDSHSVEARVTHEEMVTIMGGQCPFMNRE